jgi:hypothetical protein
VTPAINRMNEARQDRYDRAAGHAPEFIKAAMDAAAATIKRRHAAAVAAPGIAQAAE